MQKQRRSPCENLFVSKSSVKSEMHERIQFNLAAFFAAGSLVFVYVVPGDKGMYQCEVSRVNTSTSYISLLKTIAETKITSI